MKEKVVYKCGGCGLAKKSAVMGAGMKCPKCDGSMKATKTLNK